MMRAADEPRAAGFGRASGKLVWIFLALWLLIFSGTAGPGPNPSLSSADAIFNPKIGVCTSVDNATAAARAGCDYIEAGVRSFLIPDRPDEEFQEKSRGLEECPLPILAANGFLPESLKSVGPDRRHDEILAFAATAFRRARMAGIGIIVFGSSGSRNIPEGFDRAEARQQFIHLLRRMAPLAEKNGVVVVIEPLNRDECNFINTVAEGTDIVIEVGHPRIRLLADIYHMLREDEGPGSLLAAGPLLRHCHIAEKEGRTPPGVAGDDFGPYFEALKAIGYEGAISIECRWKELPRELPEAVKTMKDLISRINAIDEEN